MLDGKHAGTGGGNHVVMGAAQPEDSPFLRRPDLIKSLLGFWHNHPSLSFMFSGMFIGPTSQHPRIDEARQDVLNELEIAFNEVTPFKQTAPWMTDRMFRNILADMTGNTHRTEFCIDKMYSPDGGSGRRGLVEFRAFEMPPHAEMSCAQMLLMRAAVAAFWQTPYERRLVRWGTRLADEFMLPHYAEQDFRDALEELGQIGFPLDPDGSLRTWTSASRKSAKWRCAMRCLKSGQRSNPGMCWARSRSPGAPPATSTARSSGCRPRSAAGWTSAMCWR